MISAPSSQVKDWAAAHRPYHITRLYGDFHALLQRFHTMYADFLAGTPPSFQEISTFVGDETDRGGLWRLKELCHLLWRWEQDPHPTDEGAWQKQGAEEAALEGALLDWTVGSLFHEAMKLKENVYLRENYLPVIREALRRKQRDEAADRRRAGPALLGMECRRFVERTESEIGRQMDTMGFLFGQANVLLRLLLAAERDNHLLLRFLSEHETIVQELWLEPLAAIFAELFPGRPEEGYCAAAAGFARANWFDRAVAAYEKALKLNPACDEARRHLPQLRALARTVEGG